MQPFQLYEKIYLSTELCSAYEDACRKLGLEPLPENAADHRYVRDRLAKALINAAKLGERDPAILSDIAVTFGMRNWHLPKK
jgi:hypothetical protein